MGTTFVQHRIVVRDADNQMVSDKPYDSYVEANAAYPDAVSGLTAGQVVTLQHGARVIRSDRQEIEMGVRRLRRKKKVISSLSKSPLQARVERIVRFELDETNLPEWQKRNACRNVAEKILYIMVSGKT